MRHFTTLSIYLAALALHSAAWAEIYETTDAQGNPEFTDSPTAPGAEAVDLQQTNIIDAPPEQPQQVSAPQPVAEEQAQTPQNANPTVIINAGDDNDGEIDDDYLRRERAFNQADAAAPREVGDSSSQMPREVGDSNSQMPDEVGDFDPPAPAAVTDTDEQIVNEANESHLNRQVVHPHHR